MIYITGDLHGEVDISKLNTKNFPIQNNLSKKDYLIILGDFGLVWDNSKQEKYWRDWLESKPWTTLFIDGNHENHDILDSLSVDIWNGGKVHKIGESIIHLMRGQVFNIDNKKFFTFGGAESHDKAYRKEGKSWWSREMPNKEEMQEGIDRLYEKDFNVDYILSHTSPSDILPCVGFDYGIGELERYLNHVKYRLDEKEIKYQWYFGHYHKDLKIKDNFRCLYKSILELK